MIPWISFYAWLKVCNALQAGAVLDMARSVAQAFALTQGTKAASELAKSQIKRWERYGYPTLDQFTGAEASDYGD